MTIEELDLSVRSFNCLKRAGINTVGDLVSKSEDEMMKVRNLAARAWKKSWLSWTASALRLPTTKASDPRPLRPNAERPKRRRKAPALAPEARPQRQAINTKE